jgi:hypothetical protein
MKIQIELIWLEEMKNKIVVKEEMKIQIELN